MTDYTSDLNVDQQFWWKICKPAISGLIDHAGTYTPEEKDSHLRFFAENVTGWLGPRPAPSKDSDASPLDVASPVEASINFSDKGKPIMRFQFEPLGMTKHTKTDPLGLAGLRCLLNSLEKQFEGTDIDLQWTNHFIQTLIPTKSEDIALVKVKEIELPYPLDHAITFNVAFDLDGPKRKMKNYFFPMAKNLSTGKTCEAITFDAIRSLVPGGPKLEPAANFLEEYFKVCPDVMSTFMVGLDCTDPSKARIKMYSTIPSRNSWNAVKHICTLGGQATEATRLKGLEILHEIWPLLLDEKDAYTDDFNKPMRAPDSFLGSLMFSFEIQAGRNSPEIKTYVPIWQYAATDRQIANNLASAFRTLGWHEAADSYLTKFQQAFPGADLDGPACLHSNISYVYSEKTGAYMTVYYAVSGKATIVKEEA